MITAEDVIAFKTEYCGENTVIGELLRANVRPLILEPILDVGAGLGDVSARAFPGLEVHLLDCIPFPAVADLPSHRRITGDFFEFAASSPKRYQTAMFCHSLQFLDEDVGGLNRAIQQLDPIYVITVLNANDGFMGRLLSWARQNIARINPEIEPEGFLGGYRSLCEFSFSSAVSCQTYEELSEQVCYLLDTKPDPSWGNALLEFLRSELQSSQFPINQRIRVFQKDE